MMSNLFNNLAAVIMAGWLKVITPNKHRILRAHLYPSWVPWMDAIKNKSNVSISLAPIIFMFYGAIR